jgi:hypothetical protein
MFSDGINMLTKLHNRGYLRKYPTDIIEVTPNASTRIKLSEINEIIRKQTSGMSESDIKNSMVDDTDQPPRTQSTAQQTAPVQTQAEDGILDDNAIAQGMLTQAETFLAEAERLKAEAYAMAPDLKPKRGRKPKKATANADT